MLLPPDIPQAAGHRAGHGLQGGGGGQVLRRLFPTPAAAWLFSLKFALHVRLGSATLEDEDDQGEYEEDKDGGGSNQELLQ